MNSTIGVLVKQMKTKWNYIKELGDFTNHQVTLNYYWKAKQLKSVFLLHDKIKHKASVI